MTSTANLSTRLEGLLGGGRVVASETQSREYAIAGRAPHAVVKPAHAEEVAEVVRFAVAERLGLVCCGARSKLEIGMPPQHYDLAVDLTDMVQIAHYDPPDLTLSVDTGLPVAELSKVLAAQNQFLPLAVPCFASSTIGGTVASGIDSTLRLQYGAARDLLIGAEFVDGTGRLVPERRAGRQKCDRLRSSQTSDRIARDTCRHHPAEFPHLSAASAARWFSSELFLAGYRACFSTRTSRLRSAIHERGTVRWTFWGIARQNCGKKKTQR